MSRQVTVWIRGYKYVDIQQAADLLHYDYKSVQYWMQQGYVRTEKYEHRTLVCLSDCYELEKEKKAQKPTPQRLQEWAAANPQKLKCIRNYKDLVAALKRDKVACSRTHASAFLARWRGAGNWAVAPKVLRWIEEEPSRVGLSYRDFIKLYHATTGTVLNRYMIKRAKRKYWDRHPEPPFDAATWCNTKESARLLQVSATTVIGLMRRGKLGEVKRHKQAFYVQRQMVEALCASRFKTALIAS